MPQILEARRIPGLGIELPAIRLPDFPPSRPPQFDAKEREIIRFAFMADLGDIIPVVGEEFEHLSYKEVQRRLSPEEFDRFLEDDKWLPSTLAAAKILSETRKV